jgi:hypothetical protein
MQQTMPAMFCPLYGKKRKSTREKEKPVDFATGFKGLVGRGLPN